jgi:hypothetical protein
MKKLIIVVAILFLNIYVLADEEKSKEKEVEEPRVVKFAKKIVSAYEQIQMPLQFDKDNLLLGVEQIEHVIEFTIKNKKKNMNYEKFKNKACTRLINFLKLDGEVKYIFQDSSKVYETYHFTKDSCK